MKKITFNRKQLAEMYGWHPNTLKKRLAEIHELKLSPKKRILTPKQLKMIFDELGYPEEYKST